MCSKWAQLPPCGKKTCLFSPPRPPPLFFLTTRLWRRRPEIARFAPRGAWLHPGTRRLCAGHASRSPHLCQIPFEKLVPVRTPQLCNSVICETLRSQTSTLKPTEGDADKEPGFYKAAASALRLILRELITESFASKVQRIGFSGCFEKSSHVSVPVRCASLNLVLFVHSLCLEC